MAENMMTGKHAKNTVTLCVRIDIGAMCLLERMAPAKSGKGRCVNRAIYEMAAREEERAAADKDYAKLREVYRLPEKVGVSQE